MSITVKIVFGSSEEARNLFVRTFKTKAEAEAYRQGVEDMDGWLEYYEINNKANCPDNSIWCQNCPHFNKEECPLYD